jgi:SAM-dependent methyltransferase
MASQRRALVAADFWKASRGFSIVWTAHLGRRHGLFEGLAKARTPVSSRDLARRAAADSHAVRLWCEAAAALGLLVERGGRYELPRNLVPLLVDEEGRSFLGGHLDYLALRSLDFESFDALFRGGGRAERAQKHLAEAYAIATKWDHTAFLEVLLPREKALGAALRRGAEVLDVGTGTGSWVFRLASAFPRSRFVGVEPNTRALALARAGCAKRGLGDRVEFRRQRAEAMEFRERFDLAFLGEVLCAGDRPLSVLRRSWRALRPGGVLVVAEGLLDESRPSSDPANALLLAMRLEFALQPASFLGKRELGALLAQAGFAPARFVGAGGGFWFVAAKRPPTRPVGRASR